MLVPLLIWASGSQNSIQVCQSINRRFYNGNRKVFIRELTLSNSVGHIIKYPKVTKKDDKLNFFYEDMCKYFGWTSRELDKNISSVNIESAKVRLASAFGYDNKQRKALGLEGLNYGKKKTRRKDTNRNDGRQLGQEKSEGDKLNKYISS